MLFTVPRDFNRAIKTSMKCIRFREAMQNRKLATERFHENYRKMYKKTNLLKTPDII